MHPASSTTAAIPILSIADTSACKSWFPGPACSFRPTGLAFDSHGNLFMASEASGEIYVIGREDGASVDSVTLEIPGKIGIW